ncbi:MAG: PD40 domain-containing protein [Gemmatimonadota bacterium]|jgi:Tol biopolymer transport system component|nr:MAG: PD40 domain-containing protein [Gemmatimonadota bacterium]
MRFLSSRGLLLLGAAALLSLGPAASTANAQYFGRNKVNYDAFDWEVIRTEHFDLYFYEEERQAALMAGRMAERWYSRLSRILNHEIRARQPLVLYAAHPHFEQTNTTPEQVGESTGGFTEILKRRVVLPLQNTMSESDHVLGHELVHAFQFDITGQGPNAAGVDIPGAIRLPLWFIEGMAEYLSVGPIDPNTAMWLRDGVECDCLPTISQLNDPRFFPYRYGQALWSFVAGTYGDEIIGRILKVAGRTGSAIGAYQAVLGMTIDSLSTNWHEATREAYEPIIAATDPPETYGRLIIGGEDGPGGRQNLAPSISPDGDQLLYLADAGLFSIDLFLADANTGETIDKVTNAAVDPHFEALQFILSSGSWSQDGRRFALAGVNKGSPVISIIDVERKKRVEEYKFDTLDEITNPTWSSDGRIAFSAMQGGFSDLWVFDIETGETRRLTDDPFTDLEPEFSPDGRTIAFVTDRFDSNLGSLDFGAYQLALYDLDTDEIETLPSLDGKNINPSFTPDGRYLLFLSDETGIPNIYRLEVATGQIDQLTNVQTGVAGITALSPAMSVASRTGKIAFSLYRHGPFRWNIYTAESHEALAEAFDQAVRAREEELAAEDREVGVYPAILPPEERATDLLALIDNPRIGLADALTFDFANYKPGLSLDFVSQPSLAIGADQFGFFVGAGAQLFFSDMLGNRNLAAAIQVNTGAGSIDRSTSLVLAYENRRGRWNVGGQLSQVPLISEFVGFAVGTTPDGVPVQVLSTDRFYQINRQVLGTVTYPLNRAQRLEFIGGLQSIDFARTLKTEVFTLTGQKVFDETVDLDAPSTLNLGRVGVALVYDSSIFGGNGPVLGQRYRLDVSPAIGSISIFNFTFDYRKYFMPAFPFTIAFRGMTTGRYGPDADDPRLSSIYVGWPSLVRGYESNSFTVNECTFPGIEPGQINRCAAIDNLLGSKVAVFNLEPRLPLLGPLGVLARGAFPPVDFITFFDAGVAWTNDFQPAIFGCEDEFTGGVLTGACNRTFNTSIGFGLRLNLFGLILLEGDFVNPLQRSDKGWFFQFVANGGF